LHFALWFASVDGTVASFALSSSFISSHPSQRCNSKSAKSATAPSPDSANFLRIYE
jgi:hypothetical protein